MASGLSAAFKAALIAPAAALVVQPLSTAARKREGGFPDERSGYCRRNAISRLRAVDAPAPDEHDL